MKHSEECMKEYAKAFVEGYFAGWREGTAKIIKTQLIPLMVAFFGGDQKDIEEMRKIVDETIGKSEEKLEKITGIKE